MTAKPYKSRVRVFPRGGRDHLYVATSADAEKFVRAGLAVQVMDEFTAFVGIIELTVSLGELRKQCMAKAQQKGRPKPTLSAQSSTGDAGRGLAPLIGTHRALHFGPGVRV
jgi:hypothetical protein